MQKKQLENKSRKRGFTLVELSIVMLVAGVLVAGSAKIFELYITKRNQSYDTERQDRISHAIEAFFKDKGRLPCVADPAQPETSPAFGVEQSPDCSAAITGGITEAGTSNGKRAGYTAAERKVRVGAVPVRTLGLDDSDISNSLNYLYLYVVTTNLAITPPVTNPPQSVDVTAGMIDIDRPPVGATPAVSMLDPPYSAMYALIGPGQDGNGAWVFGGAKKPCVAGTSTYQNCKAQAGATANMFYGGSGTFVY